MTKTVRKTAGLATMGTLVLLGALLGCSNATSSSPAEAGLIVSFRADASAAPEEGTLKCGPVSATGFLVGRAEALCTSLQGRLDALEPLEPQACTQVYGGPQTAHVRGEVFGRDVDVTLGRSDGCQVSQWDEVADLVEPGPGTEATVLVR